MFEPYTLDTNIEALIKKTLATLEDPKYDFSSFKWNVSKYAT